MRTFKVWRIVGEVRIERAETRGVFASQSGPTKDKRTVLLCADNYEQAHDRAAEALMHNWSSRLMTATVISIGPLMSQAPSGGQIEVHVPTYEEGVWDDGNGDEEEAPAEGGQPEGGVEPLGAADGERDNGVELMERVEAEEGWRNSAPAAEGGEPEIAPNPEG